MFTGIVTSVGTAVSSEEDGAVRRLVIDAPALGDLPETGASIACAGVCLTVTGAERRSETFRIAVDLGPETLSLTTAGGWTEGSRINLERPLRLQDELGGHLVTGHIDGVAGIVSREDLGETVAFRFEAPEQLARYIAAKGSVALDGTSLTVNRVDGRAFDCLMIPHTLAVTTWGDRGVGDRVNLEVDLFARYAERLLAYR